MLIAAVPSYAVSGLEPAGTKIKVEVATLPAPYEERAVSNSARYRSPPAGWLPQTPRGFAVSVFSRDHIRAPREMLVGTDGALYVTDPFSDEVWRITDKNQDGKADTNEHERCQDDFDFPYGIAQYQGIYYVSDSDHIWSLGENPCEATPRALTKKGMMGRAYGHRSRNLAIAPDGSGFFVAIGSIGNIAKEPEPHATIRQFNMDGSLKKTWAKGLRNPVGIAFEPHSKKLWSVINERDWLGDKLVPDYLAQIKEDGFYGWPYFYLDGIAQPDFPAPANLPPTVMPQVLLRAHSAPLGLTFYTGKSFPQDYQGDAFIALHGSWNAGVAQGFAVARVDFEDGAPRENSYEIFMTGFRLDGGEGSPKVAGRPAGVVTWSDGSLLVSDDGAGIIWRITYTGTQ